MSARNGVRPALAHRDQIHGRRRFVGLAVLALVANRAGDAHVRDLGERFDVGMASGLIHGPLTLAMNTFGAQVTQKREWMHFLPS